MKRFLQVITALAVVLFLGYGYLRCRWHALTQAVARIEPYRVERHHDDTLRVVMIGDSWAGLHHQLGHDQPMQAMLRSALAGRPVVFASSGRGGAKSGEIYRLMFADAVVGDAFLGGYSTEPLLRRAPDYCIVMAGINDAAACLGIGQYCDNYRLIIETLTGWGIKPVVVQMPPVALREVYADKPLRDKVIDRMHALVIGSPLYDVMPYGDALLQYLEHTGLMGRLLLVRREQWCPADSRSSRRLFLSDGIHLNARGYHLLDSCIAAAVAAETVGPKK